MLNIQDKLSQSLNQMGPGKEAISPSVYDTAWIARLSEKNIPIGLQATEWLRETQLPDGSWGEQNISYSHERVVCTLAAAVALARKNNPKDKVRLEKATKAIDHYSRQLASDPFGETIGFEMIVPSLIAEAEQLDLIAGHYPYLDKINQMRNIKIATLPNGFINRRSTVVFSSEMVQAHEYCLLDFDNIQEPNGSVGCSPAATAWHIHNFDEADQEMPLNFLNNVVHANGTAPYITPIDIFEIAWSLWNIGRLDHISQEAIQASQPLLDFLEKQWSPCGLSGVSEFPLPEGDSTAMVFEALSLFGRSVDIQGLLSFQGPSYFYCFQIESNPSISTNVHVYSALRQAGYPATHPTMKMLANFLKDYQIEGKYWADKWHISSYYTTSHGIIALEDYEPDLAASAANWLIDTQQKDGGWGQFFSTPEETAYVLQALAIYAKKGNSVPDETILSGRNWLLDHAKDQQQPNLWIGKSLYTPKLVVETAIQSALELTK